MGYPFFRQLVWTIIYIYIIQYIYIYNTICIYTVYTLIHICSIILRIYDSRFLARHTIGMDQDFWVGVAFSRPQELLNTTWWDGERDWESIWTCYIQRLIILNSFATFSGTVTWISFGAGWCEENSTCAIQMIAFQPSRMAFWWPCFLALKSRGFIDYTWLFAVDYHGLSLQGGQNESQMSSS